MPKIPILLDGDPGHDDAIAWMLAAASPELEILCVTSVGGNQSIDKTTYNALRIMALLGIQAPMGRGGPRPLLSPAMTAPSVHGESGLDGPALPEPLQEPEALSAPALMARVIAQAREPVTLVPTGPLTNVAALLLAHPELKGRIKGISLMGGGIAHGNWTPAAEFNILADPEAADIVFRSGIPITMAGLDVTEQALLFPADFERIRAVGGPVAQVVADWLEFFYQFHRSMGYPGAPIHDAVAVAWLTHPELFSGRDMYVSVETAGRYCRGSTIGDPRGRLGMPANAHVLLGVDREGFARLLTQAVGCWKEG
ncbi:MAG: nucleoside hydrolase [Oscillospiraceae bacterium]|nr:nucleoside hydrolase [Oscillospiraceae bacterium]